ncbi:MAG: hypothetical protein L0099_02765, partial [Acidobacteria bacterium]|nr:hypothetical protein [Acidobacteriota bacterium]
MKPRARFLSVLLSLGIAGCHSETAGPDPNALLGPSFQAAQDDVTPPTLTALSFSPAAINTTSGSAVVTVSFSVTDDLSGAVIFCAEFTSPSTTKLRQGCINFAAATNHSGTVDISFPQFGEAGIWKLSVSSVQDAAGNYRSYTPADLAAAGFPTDLDVTSVQDSNAPILTAIDFSPTSISTTSGSAVVTVSFSV